MYCAKVKIQITQYDAIMKHIMINTNKEKNLSLFDRIGSWYLIIFLYKF